MDEITGLDIFFSWLYFAQFLLAIIGSVNEREKENGFGWKYWLYSLLCFIPLLGWPFLGVYIINLFHDIKEAILLMFDKYSDEPPKKKKSKQTAKSNPKNDILHR